MSHSRHIDMNIDAENNGSTEITRPTRRRGLLACENCRRKKSRCPGEFPHCSVCTRLKQRCVYSHSSPQKRKTPHSLKNKEAVGKRYLVGLADIVEERMASIEQRLDQMVTLLDTGVNAQRDTTDSDISFRTSIQPPNGPTVNGSLVQAPSSSLLAGSIALKAIECYFKALDCQPYPLLSHLHTSTLPAPSDFDPVVLEALLCMTLPILVESRTVAPLDAERIATACEESVWSFLCLQYQAMEFNDTYFQALCLLAQADFASGKTCRAQMQVTLGLRATELNSYAGEYANTACRSDIVCTLFMLSSVFGCVRQPGFTDSMSHSVPQHQGGPAWPLASADVERAFNFAQPVINESESPPKSVVTVTIELLNIWRSITSHVRSATDSTNVAFWRHDSPRAGLITQLTEFELRMELHSYTTTGSPTQILDKPHLRPYFAARFFLHVLHTGCLCLLYHPFTAFTSTRHLKGKVPGSYLQNSYNICNVNSNWTAMLLKDMDKSRVTVYDPLVGYFVAVSATVLLDRTLRKHDEKQEAVEQKFRLCYEYIKKMSSIWQSMKNALRLLDSLGEALKRTAAMPLAEDEYDGEVRVKAMSDVAIPEVIVRIMRRLFDYEALSSQFQPEIDMIDDLVSSNARRVGESSDEAVRIEDGGIVWDELPVFDDQSQENEWLLFGIPWTAYCSGDPTLPTQLA